MNLFLGWAPPTIIRSGWWAVPTLPETPQSTADRLNEHANRSLVYEQKRPERSESSRPWGCVGGDAGLFKPEGAPDAARVKLGVARLLGKADPLFVRPDDDLGRMAVDSPGCGVTGGACGIRQRRRENRSGTRQRGLLHEIGPRSDGHSRLRPSVASSPGLACSALGNVAENDRKREWMNNGWFEVSLPPLME